MNLRFHLRLPTFRSWCRAAVLICVHLWLLPSLCAQSLTLPLEKSTAGWLVAAEVNGRPALLLLDTGSTVTALDARHLRLPRTRQSRAVATGRGVEQRAVLAPVTLRLAVAAAAPKAGQQSLQPGAFTHIEQTIEAADLDLRALRDACLSSQDAKDRCQIAGLLGMNFLGQFVRLTLDFDAATLTLEPRP